MQNDWRKISIKENDIEKFGMFYDLDEEGFLLLRTKDGIEKSILEMYF